MNKVILMFSMISTSAYADAGLICKDPQNSALEYRVSPVGKLSEDRYILAVFQTKADPGSCQSRWGCDFQKVKVYEEQMKMRSVDGPQYTIDTYQGPRSRLKVTDGQTAIYTYMKKVLVGAPVKTNLYLNCEEN